jgi:hypothetical protein
MKKTLKLIFCLTILFTQVGCGIGIFGPVQAYQGSSRPSEQTAIIEVAPYTLGSPPGDNYGSIKDISVDGVSYSNFLQADDKREKKYSILSGNRKIQVTYERGLSVCSIGANPNFFLGTSSSATRETCRNQNVKHYLCTINLDAKSKNDYEIQITSDFNNMRGLDPNVSIEAVLKKDPDSVIKTGRCSKN